MTLLPFAPIAGVEREDLPGVIRQIKDRIDEEADEDNKVRVWSATSLLMGLNYSRSFVQELFKNMWNMQDSSVYRGILEDGRAEGIALGIAEGKAAGKAEGIAEGKAEGKAEGERRLLLRLGTKRLGEPDAQTRTVIESITSLQRLDELADRLLDVETWQELLEV